MRYDIRRAVANCATCLLTKASVPIAKGVEKSRQPTALWETVAIDMMVPYLRTSRGKRFILVATDLMSRWVEAFAVSSTEVNVIAPILEREVFMRGVTHESSSATTRRSFAVRRGRHGVSRGACSRTRRPLTIHRNKSNGTTKSRDEEGAATSNRWWTPARLGPALATDPIFHAQVHKQDHGV